MPTLFWRERSDTPTPAGLVAAGAAAHATVRALARRDTAELTGLTVIVASGQLILFGRADRLPWVEGVRYCAPAPDAPGLWLPTWLAPDLPADLVHASLQRRTGHAALLLWTEPDFVLPLNDALPVDAAVLAWLDKELD
jgi:hypothetical protein